MDSHSEFQLFVISKYRKLYKWKFLIYLFEYNLYIINDLYFNLYIKNDVF